MNKGVEHPEDAAILRTLRRIGRKRWPALALVCGLGGSRLVTRAQLAQLLHENDLPQLAREAMRRRVPPHQILTLEILENAPPRFGAA